MMMQGSPRIDELRQKFHENPRRYFAPLANEYRKAGDPEQAIAICRAHLAQQPGHMSGHVVYGQALYDAKRPEEARVVFEKALSLDPDNAIVLKQLGDIAREKGDNAEARHWYSRALDVDPGDNETAAYIAELTEPITAEPTPEEAAPVESAQEEAVSASADEPVSPPADEPVSPPADEPVSLAAHEPVSPFVTRTMAELYASQGYRSAALDVYRQLALHNPDDKEIMDRIEELSREEETPAPQAEIEPVQAAEQTVASIPETVDAGEHLISDEDFTFQELDNEITFAPTDEDLNLVADAAPPHPEKHFTETELGSSGDSWDSDSWAAGFSADEALSPEFDAPETMQPIEPIAGGPEIETPAEAETALDEAGAEPVEEIAAPVEEIAEPVAEIAEHAAAASAVEIPEPVAETFEPIPAIPEAVSEIPEPVEEIPEPVTDTHDAAPETAAPEPEPAAEEIFSAAEPESEPQATFAEAESEPEPIVAYSPELPEDDELPHFAPKGPTVREFFATLGAKRPPSANTITARTAVPDIKSQPQASETHGADFPLANDAFANMFAHERVNEDDARAAFALSGALAASETPASRTPTPPKPVAAPDLPPPGVPATTEESEEDIRRFREWLDGLSDT